MCVVLDVNGVEGICVDVFGQYVVLVQQQVCGVYYDGCVSQIGVLVGEVWLVVCYGIGDDV